MSSDSLSVLQELLNELKKQTLMELLGTKVEACMTPSYTEDISGHHSACAITVQDKERLESQGS